MLTIDLLTTYVICGAASCVAALLSVQVRAGDPALARAVHTCSV